MEKKNISKRQFQKTAAPAEAKPAELDAPTLEDLILKIAAYDYGQSLEPLSSLTDMIGKAHGSAQTLNKIEKALITLLGTKATPAAKQFTCEQLGLIGTKDSIKALAPMLKNAETSDMARYALERIPGTAVDTALREALDKTGGKIKVGILNSIGVRRDSKAVAALGKLVGNSDTDVAAAAASSLGKIGTVQAADELSSAKDKADDKLKMTVLNGCLTCAERLLAQGNKDKAMAIYKQLNNPDEPKIIQAAAARGLVAVEKRSEKPAAA